MTKRTNTKFQSGAVALFVVIFSTLLLSIVTLSYIQLMIKDQQQASNSDLSQSAYDSAQAGVEDAKRLLLMNQECETNSSALPAATCTKIENALTTGLDVNGQTGCDVLDGLVSTATPDADGNNETLVQEGEGNALNQAYTCVKIALNTDSVQKTLSANQSLVIPLQATGSFSQVELDWFTRDDAGGPTVKLPAAGDTSFSLPSNSQWAKNDPTLLRTHLIQTGSSFTLSDFDQDNSRTLFLYPMDLGGITSITNFTQDARRPSGSPEAPAAVSCKTDLSAGGYACTARLSLPNPVGGSAATRHAYLHLTALYNATNLQIKLHKNANSTGNSDIVQFAGVQPEVDSTGRANDQFRRVQARVELRSDDLAYPDAELTLTGNLCKNFIVTTNSGDYQSYCSPDPNS